MNATMNTAKDGVAGRRRIGVAVLGLGWMGQAHSRSVMRIPSLFPERRAEARLVVCADIDADRRRRAVSDFGFDAPSRTGARPSPRRTWTPSG